MVFRCELRDQFGEVLRSHRRLLAVAAAVHHPCGSRGTEKGTGLEYRLMRTIGG